MLSFIFRILLLAFIIWIVRRFLGLFLGSAKKPNRKNAAGDTANYMVKDPVCGMYMDSRLAVSLQNGKEVIYFCSEECRKRYLNESSGGKSGPDSD